MLGKFDDITHFSYEDFKYSLVKIWDDVPYKVLRASCNDFQKRLRAVLKYKGERCEH